MDDNQKMEQHFLDAKKQIDQEYHQKRIKLDWALEDALLAKQKEEYANKFIHFKPVRIENVLMVSTRANIRDSLQNITVNTKTLVLFEINGRKLKQWLYMGKTDQGAAVSAYSYSSNVSNFRQLKWDIPAGAKIPKDIYINH